MDADVDVLLAPNAPAALKKFSVPRPLRKRIGEDVRGVGPLAALCEMRKRSLMDEDYILSTFAHWLQYQRVDPAALHN